MLVDIWSSYYLSIAPWAGQSPILSSFAATALILLIASAVLPPKQYAPAANVAYYLKKRLRAWAYLFNGPGIIREEFLKSEGKPLEINAPDVRMVFISEPKHIREVDKAPDDVLSLNGAAKHMLQPLYTMNGFNWFDKRGVEGVGFVRTLRTLLTNHLPALVPDLAKLAKDRWAELLSTKKSVDGVIYAPVYPMMMNLVVLLNARSLFGEDLIQDKTFMHSALGYVEETLVNAEIVKLLPNWLGKLVGSALSYIMPSHRTFFKSLVPATEERIAEKDHVGPPRNDCIQWIIDTAPKKGNPWSAERVIYELMAIWFGSVHILSTTMVYVIHDLCLHPEYLEPLRKELDESYADFERTGKGLPLLDSFIKESARLTPVESMSIRRCALKPFTLSEGSHVDVGQWVCAPSGAINTAPNYYPSPDEFSGFRFVSPEVWEKSAPQTDAPRQEKPTDLTQVEDSWLMWGTGRMACPGRYYATAFMKVVIAQLIMNYDFSLVKPDAPRWLSWRVARIPRPWTELAFKPRKATTA